METNAVLDLLDKFRIRTSTDCSELSKLSEKTVKVSGGLPTGGYLFLQLMISCWERYDVSTTCCGIDKEVGLISATMKQRSKSLFRSSASNLAYLDSATEVVPSDEGLLRMCDCISLGNIQRFFF